MSKIMQKKGGRNMLFFFLRFGHRQKALHSNFINETKSEFLNFIYIRNTDGINTS